MTVANRAAEVQTALAILLRARDERRLCAIRLKALDKWIEDAEKRLSISCADFETAIGDVE